MDSGPKVEPSFDAAKPQSVNEAASAAPQDGAPSAGAPASLEDTSTGSDKPKEKAVPKVPPIPSSALVILPPSKQRFEAKDAAKEGRPRKRTWLGAASRAALLLILCGGCFAAGGRYFGSIPLLAHFGNPGAVSWQAAKNDDSRTAIAALGAEMQRLDANVASLRAADSPDAIRALKKSVDELKASFETANTSIAQLSTKLDQIAQGEPRLTRTSLERSERNENTDPRAIQATLDRAAREGKSGPVTTASLPASAEPQSATDLPAGRANGEQRRPPLLTNWVVRDVYDGIALVEGPQGALEVMPGDTIPGAGTVKSIERRGAGWIVLTSRGLVDYAGD
jgi:hypothetical protein